MSVDAKELRIGNLVSHSDYGNIFGAVISLNSDNGIETQYSDFGREENLLPIPLTKEILEKSGFKISKGTIANSTAIYSDFNNFRIYLGGGENTVHFNVDDKWYPKLLEIKYVHTFQNWYFSNIGTEINLTL